MTKLIYGSDPDTDYILSAEYNHLPYPRLSGHVSLSTFAEVCAQAITDNFEVVGYLSDPKSNWKDVLSSRIESIILESKHGIAVAVTALGLIERYQDELVELGDCEADEVEGVCCLFLTAYIVAGKFVYDKSHKMAFWMQVAGSEYTAADLAFMERYFLESIGWRMLSPDHYFDVLQRIIERYDCAYTTKTAVGGIWHQSGRISFPSVLVDAEKQKQFFGRDHWMATLS